MRLSEFDSVARARDGATSQAREACEALRETQLSRARTSFNGDVEINACRIA